jgi:hypothetical protein
MRHLAAREHRRLTLPLAAISIVSTLATAASPWLARWPLVLAMLSPRVPFLALAAVGTPLPVFLVLGTARLCIADPFHYLLGRRLAKAGLARVRAPGRLARRIERCSTPGSFLAIVLRPIGRHLFAAGMTRARPVPVALADIASTIAFLVALYAGAGIV